MKRQADLRVEATFNAPIDEAWAFFSDFGNLPTAVEGVHDVEVFGSGVGAVRRVPFEDHWTDERLEVMEPAAHLVVYSVTDGSGSYPLENYVAKMQLVPIDNEHCRFTWHSHFTVGEGGDLDGLRSNLERAYRISIDGFRAQIER